MDDDRSHGPSARDRPNGHELQESKAWLEFRCRRSGQECIDGLLGCRAVVHEHISEDWLSKFIDVRMLKCKYWRLQLVEGRYLVRANVQAAVQEAGDALEN